jgi:hypothetical protein
MSESSTINPKSSHYQGEHSCPPTLTLSFFEL